MELPAEYFASVAVAYKRLADSVNVSEIGRYGDYLSKVVGNYEEALRREEGGLARAMMQNNLGAAYRTLGEVRDKEQNVGLAIRAYGEALKVRTLEQFPIDYAMTQNNLGNAYRTLGEVRDKEKNMGLAIEACGEALKALEHEEIPELRIVVERNLSELLEELR